MRRSTWRVACCCVPLFGLAVLGVVGWRLARDHGDLSKMPPADVFGRVLGITPPAGVTHLRAAGYQPLDGDAWLTFEAADVDAVLGTLKRSAERGLAGPSADDGPTMRQWVADAVRYNGRRARPAQLDVGWGRIGAAGKLEYYQFPAVYHGSGWSGWVAVDRRHRRFFVYAVCA